MLASVGLAWALLAGVPATTHAGYGSGTVARIFSRNDGLVLVMLNGPHYAKPACATNSDYWAIKNENSGGGKQQIATLLSAYLAGRTVWIDGGAGIPTQSGTCTRWPDLEDVGYVILCSSSGVCN